MQKNHIPLLKSQGVVFEECMQYPDCRQYNLPTITELGKDADVERMIRAYEVVFRARPEWRIRFGVDEESLQPYQFVDETRQLHIARLKMTRQQCLDYAYHSFCRPFDLMGDEPLIRVSFIETPDNVYLLMDVHHLIMDGVSYAMLFSHKDYNEAYTTGRLSVSQYSMLDAARDEQFVVTDIARQKGMEYYSRMFKDLDFITLSKPFTNPIGRLLRTHAFVSADDVDCWCCRHDVSPNYLFLSAFCYAVSVMTGKKRLGYTIYVHGRFEKRLRNTFGMFSRELPVISEIKDNQSVVDFVLSLRTDTIAALRYSAYPLADLCKDLHKTSGICFNFQAIEGMEEMFVVGDETYVSTEIERGDDGHDMVVFVFLLEGKYEIRIESSDAINSIETVQTLTERIRDKVLEIIGNIV